MTRLLWFKIYTEYIQIKLFYQGASLLFSGVFQRRFLKNLYTDPPGQFTQSWRFVIVQYVGFNPQAPQGKLPLLSLGVLPMHSTGFGRLQPRLIEFPWLQYIFYWGELAPCVLFLFFFFPGSHQSLWNEAGLVTGHRAVCSSCAQSSFLLAFDRAVVCDPSTVWP